MTDEARIPSPDDWSLSWGDLAMILQPHRHGRARQKVLMNRFYITEKTASCWLEGLRRWEQENQREAS